MNDRLGIALAAAAFAAGGLTVWWWAETQSADGPASAVPEAAADAGGAAPRLVRLTDAKREAAGIQVAPVERRMIQRMHQVPGRLQYDDTRHVEIKAAADGILRKSVVKPGDHVERGQILAVLSSPEIGLARADVWKRQSELELTERQYQWRRQTNQNLQELVTEIQSQRRVEEIEVQFHGRPLGSYRETLISAYARLLLAQSMLASIQTATDRGAAAARTLRERTSERQTAEAVLQSACEQSAFDARLQSSSAEASVQDATRRLDVARQHLSTLLGYEQQPDAAQPGPDADPELATGAAASLVESRAPFTGTIESKRFTESERVRQGETLFVLADTSQLWAVADLREQDWQILDLQPNAELALTLPALQETRLTARLYYVGREVMTDTNALPLVACVQNPDGKLRPGLFVRMSVPLGHPREALAVPAASVVQDEQGEFVFVAESTTEFRRTDVHIGESTDDWIEIVAGLTQGTPVVVSGAFELKSELLLEREE